jgi:hypothetical protein
LRRDRDGGGKSVLMFTGGNHKPSDFDNWKDEVQQQWIEKKS